MREEIERRGEGGGGLITPSYVVQLPTYTERASSIGVGQVRVVIEFVNER